MVWNLLYFGTCVLMACILAVNKKREKEMLRGDIKKYIYNCAWINQSASVQREMI